MSRSDRPRARGLSLLAIAALLATLAPATVAAQEKVVLKIGVTQTATETGLNPFLATASADYRLLVDVYDLLLEFGPALEPAPGIAESFEVSGDGLTYTYQIRQGVKWQDGQTLTAEDVRFTYQYYIDSHDPAYTGPAAPDGNDVDVDGSADNQLTLFDNYLDLDAGLEEMRIESIEAPDEKTLVITTREPLISLQQIYLPVMPKHLLETITFEQAANENIDQPIGSGPFKVVEFNPDSVIRLEANKDYWGGAPRIDELIYQYFQNDEAAVNALKSGEVDLLTDVPALLVPSLEGDPNITLNRAPTTDFGELGFNSWDPTPERFESEGCADCLKGPTTGSLGDPWLTRPEVRAALAGLVDKKELVERALGGFGIPADSFVGPLNAFYHYEPDPNDPVNFPSYSGAAGRLAAREQAAARFQEAMAALGFSDTDGNGILNVPVTAEATAFDPAGAGKDWSLRLFIRDDDEEDKIAGELLESWFEAAGVAIDRQLVKEDPQLYDATYPASTNADMDMYIWGWGPDPDPDFILSVFTCNQINNWQDVNYCDAGYDATYRETRTTIDRDARAGLVKGLQDKIFHEAPYVVLWHPDSIEAYRSDRWEGFQLHPAEGGYLWSNWGFGPYNSRTTVAPKGAGPAPTPTPRPGAATPTPVGATPAPTTAPTPAPTPAPSGGGDTTTLIAVIVVVAVVVVGGGILFARRRAAQEEE